MRVVAVTAVPHTTARYHYLSASGNFSLELDMLVPFTLTPSAVSRQKLGASAHVN